METMSKQVGIHSKATLRVQVPNNNILTATPQPCTVITITQISSTQLLGTWTLRAEFLPPDSQSLTQRDSVILLAHSCVAMGPRDCSPDCSSVHLDLGVTLGLYWDNGKEDGNYHLEFRAKGLGLIVPLKFFCPPRVPEGRLRYELQEPLCSSAARCQGISFAKGIEAQL